MSVQTWKLPAVGKVDARVVAGVGVAAGGFVAWQWWRNRNASTDTTDDGTDTATSDFADDGSVPGVLGAVSPTNSYGLSDDSGDATQPSTDDYGFSGSTNSEWTQYVSAQLSQSDTWSYSDILAALGNYLAGSPLSSLQQTIVKAGIAVGGTPPVGQHVLISGGDTPITVAPSISGITTTEDTAVLQFTPVAGATGYRAYRNGVATNVGQAAGTTITVGGLTPNTKYAFHVRAMSPSGATGPSSAAKSATTKALNLATPHPPKVSAVAKTSAHVSTAVVKGADGYNWTVNGVPHGHSDAPSYTLTDLHGKTSYKVSVAADTSTGKPGKSSAATSFKTK